MALSVARYLFLLVALLAGLSLAQPNLKPVTPEIRPVKPNPRPANVDVSHETAFKYYGKYILGSQCDSDGDVMAITYCYCGLPDKDAVIDTKWPEAHYVEVNYYNVHLNVTFNLNETCISNNRGDCLGHKVETLPVDKMEFIPPKVGSPDIAQDEWGTGYREIQWNGMCATWSKEKQNHNGYWEYFGPQPEGGVEGYGVYEPNYRRYVDKFCFWPNPGYYKEYPKDQGQPDRTFYNGQRRWLRNGQGFVDFKGQEVRGTCEKQCQERTGMPIMPVKKGEVQSHQHCALALDDMCQHCK